MATTMAQRSFVRSITSCVGQHVVLRGWVYRLRVLRNTTFVVLRDCTGMAQCVASSEYLGDLHLKLDDTVEVTGIVRTDARAMLGCEVDVDEVRVLSRATNSLPFNSASDISSVGLDTRLQYRPLAMRTDVVGNVFRIQNELLRYFREYLAKLDFSEIITSKIVASGTEGGTNLFSLTYFERTAYLAQSPQLYKEHGVAAFERVFETGHVYRAEPHASSRHLTEYYSLDLELGFIDGPEDLIEIEKGLLSAMLGSLHESHGEILEQFGALPLPAIEKAPTWEFDDCLDLLAREHGITHLTDDLDPEAERLLCELAERATGVPAVFVIGFPLSNRPFYTAPRGDSGAAQTFDLLLKGVEVTTGGQRLHRRDDLERAMALRGFDIDSFADHLQMFELGMPPHGGLAIGLERLTVQILGLSNVREAVMYPRDRHRLSP